MTRIGEEIGTIVIEPITTREPKKEKEPKETEREAVTKR